MYPEYDPISIQAMTQSVQDDDILTRLVLRNKQTY